MTQDTEVFGVSCGTLTWRKIADEYEVLLIRQAKSYDSWGVPKGHLKENETHEQCAIRETFEETGIDVELLEALPRVYHKSWFENKWVYIWTAKPLSENAPNCNSTDCEVADAKWWNMREVPQLIAYQQKLIKGAIDRIVGISEIEATIEEKLAEEIAEALTIMTLSMKTSDFVEIKKQLIHQVSPKCRAMFSTQKRDEPYKINDFERWLGNQWEKLTGRPVVYRK